MNRAEGSSLSTPVYAGFVILLVIGAIALVFVAFSFLLGHPVLYD